MFSPSTLKGNLGELFQQLMRAKNILNSFELSLIYIQKHPISMHKCSNFASRHLLFWVHIYWLFYGNGLWIINPGKTMACVFCCFEFWMSVCCLCVVCLSVSSLEFFLTASKILNPSFHNTTAVNMFRMQSTHLHYMHCPCLIFSPLANSF